MLTYQDLQDLEDSDNARMDFVLKVINWHKGSKLYKTAVLADEYIRKQNRTIMQYEKMLVDVRGRLVKDELSPNHKIVSGFFDRFVTQQNQYLLSNGVMWQNENTVNKLGKDFDVKLQELGEGALIGGVSFGFWNYNHLEVFYIYNRDTGCFAPLYDEETGALRSGVRFWQIDETKPLRATLYEEDGYTDYVWNTREEKQNRYVLQGKILKPKQPYITITKFSKADGVQILSGQNYPSFPIIPLWANKYHQSELIGIQEGIDAYDLIKNGFENDLDNAQLYWIVKGAGGMDDMDLTQFLRRLNQNKIASTELDQEINPVTVNIPFEARERLLDRIERDLYRDYQAFNPDDVKSGSTVNAQIKAAYEPINLKADKYEYQILKFINSLLSVVGIEDKPTFTRSRLINTQEEIQTIIMAGDILSQEYKLKKILTLLGDGDKFDEIMKQLEENEIETNSGNMEEMLENSFDYLGDEDDRLSTSTNSTNFETT